MLRKNALLSTEGIMGESIKLIQYGEENMSLAQKYAFTKKPQFLLNQHETKPK